MKILATRRFPGAAWEELDDVELLPLDRLTGRRPDVEALIAANERVDAAVLDLLPALRIVANYGVGYDRVDVEACAARDVAVTHTPGVLDAATADLAFALILAVRRRIVEGDGVVRRGAWRHGWSEGFLGAELTGATLGIVGFGRIGQAVARRAQAFELRVLYARRRAEASELGEQRELEDLLREADVVTLHTPLTDETARLIDGRRLALMRDGTSLVNTARGEIVDEPALVRELVSGRLRAGLDVFAHEPDVPPELLALPNVVLTPHLGSATVETRAAMTRLVVDNVLAAAAGRPLPTPVPR